VGDVNEEWRGIGEHARFVSEGDPVEALLRNHIWYEETNRETTEGH
jgi:hypothetical protein